MLGRASAHTMCGVLRDVPIMPNVSISPTNVLPCSVAVIGLANDLLQKAGPPVKSEIPSIFASSVRHGISP